MKNYPFTENTKRARACLRPADPAKIMTHAGSGEEASYGEEPDCKRPKQDPDGQKSTGKSVIVLLHSDVTFGGNGGVFMPNTIEMARLKKRDRGQYVGKIDFTRDMTVEDVRKRLCLKLPILQNKRLSCASAVENRTKLEFHGQPRLWDGTLIQRHIRGNSALYLLEEENPETGRVLDESNVPTMSNVSTYTVSSTVTRPLTVQKQSLFSQTQSLRQENLLAPTAFNRYNDTHSQAFSSAFLCQPPLEQDTTAEKRSIPGQSTCMPNLGNLDSSGALCHSLTQNTDAEHNDRSTTGQQPTSQLVTNPTPTEALQQSTVYQVPVTTSVQPQADLRGTSLVATQRLKELSEKSLPVPTATNQGFVTKKGDNFMFSSDANLQKQPALLQTGQQGSWSQEGLTAAATHKHCVWNKTEQPFVNQRKRSSSGKKAYYGVHPENSTPEVQHSSNLPSSILPGRAAFNFAENTNQAHTQDRMKQITNIVQSYLQDFQEKAGKEDEDEDEKTNWTDIKTPSQLLNMSEEEFDSAIEDINDVIFKDIGQSGVVQDISPPSGSTEGGTFFYIILSQELPKEATSLTYTATFEGVKEVPLDVVNKHNLRGVSPASQRPGTVKVTVKESGGSWLGTASFTYVNLDLQALLGAVVKNEDKRKEFFDVITLGLSRKAGGNEDQATDTFGLFTSQSNRDAWSLQILVLLIYKAAQIDGQDFIKIIFSTSSGKAVFNKYKNRSTLPEDVARANGHEILANYLQDINHRLSEENRSNVQTKSIDWVELKHAMNKEQSLPGTEKVQPLVNQKLTSCLESDDNKSEYFADDEMSDCSSPCHNKASDCENSEEPDNAGFEQEESFMLPLKQTGNRTEFVPDTNDKNATEYVQRFSDEVDSHSSEDDMDEEKRSEAFLAESELEDWSALKSEVKSSPAGMSTETTSSSSAALLNISRDQDRYVIVTGGSENCLDGVKKGLKKIDESTRIEALIKKMIANCAPCGSGCGIVLIGIHRLKEPVGSSQKALSHYTELFTEKTQNGVVPKRILVQGNAGIGKSTLVNTLFGDWCSLVKGSKVDEEEEGQTIARPSQTEISHFTKPCFKKTKEEAVSKRLLICESGLPGANIFDRMVVDRLNRKETKTDEEQNKVLRKFELVIVFNLEDVSKCLPLREIISSSHMFSEEEECLIDDLLDYICKNQEKILLVFDSYDKYLTGSKAPEKSRRNSSVYNIFQGNVLRDCTVLVTTRPPMDAELQRFADVQAKITGIEFCCSQEHSSESDEVVMIEESLLESTIKEYEQTPAGTTSFGINIPSHPESNSAKSIMEFYGEDKKEFKKLENDETFWNKDLIPPAILARGSNALAAYSRALEHGKICDKHVPIMFIGNEGTGKTSLKRSLTLESFNKDEARTAAMDTSGLLTELTSPLLHDKVFTSDSERFDNLPQEIVSLVEGMLQDDQSTIVDEIWTVIWDFGGQSLYYDIHPIFMSHEAVYVLTYDLSKDLFQGTETHVKQSKQRVEQRAEMSNRGETNLDHVTRWMDWIHSFQDPSSMEASGIPQPPVFLVGTHADETVEYPLHVMDSILNSLGKDFSSHIIEEQFVVNNTRAGQPFQHEDQNVQRLRKKIISVASTLPRTKREIPIQWRLVEKSLHRLASYGIKHITKTNFKAIANKICQFEVEEDSEELLHFLCDCGAVLCFNEADHSNSLVFLDPQWLINVFCQIVSVDFSMKEPVYIQAHQRTLAKDGILSEELINYACQNLGLKLSPDSLLSIMEKWNLICRWAMEDGRVVYLIPSMLSAKPCEEIPELTIQESIRPIYIKFHTGYVPCGLFSRFLVLFGQYASSELSTRPPQLFANAARFFIGEKSNYILTFACFKRVIMIHLVYKGKSEDGKETIAICEQVCRFVEDILVVLGAECRWLHSMKWKLCARCDLCVGVDDDPDGCRWHRVHCCPHPDCAHFVPLDSQPLRCDKTYRLNSLLTEDKLQPWKKYFHYRNQDTGQLKKKAVVSLDDLLLIARDLGKQWRRLGRILLDENELERIDDEQNSLYDKCFTMLTRWKQAKGSSATYAALGKALMYDLRTKELLFKFCLAFPGVVQTL